MNLTELFPAIEELTPDLVSFTQSLLQIPSWPGQERERAQCIQRQFEKLEYAASGIDQAGNVWGSLTPVPVSAPTLLCLSHLDQPPINPLPTCHIEGDFLTGWGASDNVSALAVHVYTGYLLRRFYPDLPWGYQVAATVQEYSGTIFGIQYFVDHTLDTLAAHIGLALVGSPTGLKLFLGQRGKAQLLIHAYGRTCNSDTPWLGINALTQSTVLLDALNDLALSLPSHPVLERATLAPVQIECCPGITGRIPDTCSISIDRRYLNTETPDELLQQIIALIHRLRLQNPELKAEAEIKTQTITSYTGYACQLPCVLPALLIEPNDSRIQSLRQVLQPLCSEREYGIWRTCSSASYIQNQKGVLTVGYAPGDERYAHTSHDRICISAMKEALAGYGMIYSHFSEIIKDTTL